MEPSEIRTMVLQFGAQMAHRLVTVVRNAALATATSIETTEVAGVTWIVTATYYTSSDFVMINGAPEVTGHPYSMAFHQSGEDDNGSFGINLPRTWLPSVEAETLLDAKRAARR